MTSDLQTPTPGRSGLSRLETAVSELEGVLDHFESAHRATAEELARTKAELTALRTLHDTVSRRLDDAIARLKAVLVAEGDSEDDHPDG